MATVEHTETDVDELQELAYVGPRSAELLAAADVAPADVREKRVSYRDLVDAGVNPGVAAKLRREHSLHWTLDEQGADLDRRSELVRNLRDEERAWIASARGDASDDASDDGDGATATGGDWTVEGDVDWSATVGPGCTTESEDDEIERLDGDWTPSGDEKHGEEGDREPERTADGERTTNADEKRVATTDGDWTADTDWDPETDIDPVHDTNPGDWLRSPPSEASDDASAEDDAFEAEAAWRRDAGERD